MESVRENPKRVVFAEGEDEKTVRAAVAFSNAGYGTPVLIGREETVRDVMARLGLGRCPQVEIHNARLSHANKRYAEHLYAKLQRRGYLLRDCQRMVNQNRNVFAACMVATGDADAMITGLTRSAAVSLQDIGLRHRARAGRARVRPDADGRHARPHDLHRRHDDALPPERARRWPRSPSGRRRRRGVSATNPASRCCRTRPSAIRATRAPRRCARRSPSSTSAGSISSTTAR